MLEDIFKRVNEDGIVVIYTENEEETKKIGRILRKTNKKEKRRRWLKYTYSIKRGFRSTEKLK